MNSVAFIVEINSINIIRVILNFQVSVSFLILLLLNFIL